MDIYLPITYDAQDRPHIRQPHTTETGATWEAECLADEDLSIWRYEVATMELVDDDAVAAELPDQGEAIVAWVRGRLGKITHKERAR